MSTAITANLNLVAAPGAAATSNPRAVIAALVARILQQTPASNAAQTANPDASIILTPLLDPTHDAAPMELNLNQLLNSSVLQKVLTQLPPELLSRPQVIEALVLQNTQLQGTAPDSNRPALPLLQLPANFTAPAAAANSLYRVNIEWQNRLIQLLSPQPLPTGTRVPLQIDAHGAIKLLPLDIAAKILLQQTISTTDKLPLQTAPLPQTPTQTIQQSLRELLPRQEALHTLVPLLQKFIQPAVREQLPPPVFKALAQLLQSLPKPAQMNNAETVKQALNNSGSFFEARLAQTVTAEAAAEPLPQIFATDIKAQIGALLGAIRKFMPNLPNTPTTPGGPIDVEDDFVYNAKLAAHNASAAAAPHDSEPLDTLLSQLSKLLQAGFARIQLNQLDSASTRHLNQDLQQPVPTWVLELPLRTPHGIDQLQLRIEQRQHQQQQRKRVQWNVQIAFDLHAAGKLAATLAIVDKTVSATLWAEREHTHRRVREEMDYLRAGLESVGVKVTEMQCRLGLPTPRANPISQQLVDVHT